MTADFATQNPFALLTLIVAPAVLTNATSVLALSTSNRFLRAGERLRAEAESLEAATTADERTWRLTYINRIERQAGLLLKALRADYVALGGFVSASLISVVGAGFAAGSWHIAATAMIVLALLVGFIAAGALVFACLNLFQATRLSMMNIAEEAARIRAKEGLRLRSEID